MQVCVGPTFPSAHQQGETSTLFALVNPNGLFQGRVQVETTILIFLLSSIPAVFQAKTELDLIDHINMRGLSLICGPSDDLHPCGPKTGILNQSTTLYSLGSCSNRLLSCSFSDLKKLKKS
jgi:hypothetical protein